MRFILLEAAKDAKQFITPEIINTYKTGDPKTKESTVRKIMSRLGNYTKFYECFTTASTLLGIDPKYNPFWDLLPRIIDNVKATDKHIPYMTSIIQMYNSGQISQDSVNVMKRTIAYGPTNPNHYLGNPSLYHRNIEEFKYTVKVFEIVLNPDMLSKFIKDTSKVNIEDLYEGKNIKPSGLKTTGFTKSGGHDESTIKGIVEWWTRLGGDAGGVSSEEKGKSDKKEDRIKLSDSDKAVAKKSPVNTLKDLSLEKNPPYGDIAYVSKPLIPGISPNEINGGGKPGYYVYTADRGWERAV